MGKEEKKNTRGSALQDCIPRERHLLGFPRSHQGVHEAADHLAVHPRKRGAFGVGNEATKRLADKRLALEQETA